MNIARTECKQHSLDEVAGDLLVLGLGLAREVPGADGTKRFEEAVEQREPEALALELVELADGLAKTHLNGHGEDAAQRGEPCGDLIVSTCVQ